MGAPAVLTIQVIRLRRQSHGKFGKHHAVGTPNSLDRLEGLLARELAPSSLRFRAALRLTTVATIGAALVVRCHLNSELGTYIVWLMVGAGPMMSLRNASGILVAEAFLLASSVVMARVPAETVS